MRLSYYIFIVVIFHATYNTYYIFLYNNIKFKYLILLMYFEIVHLVLVILIEINIYSANSYNIRHIGELLFQLLTQALKYYPCNVPWLRLMGDLNFGTFCFIK